MPKVLFLIKDIEHGIDFLDLPNKIAHRCASKMSNKLNNKVHELGGILVSSKIDLRKNYHQKRSQERVTCKMDSKTKHRVYEWLIMLWRSFIRGSISTLLFS